MDYCSTLFSLLKVNVILCKLPNDLPGLIDSLFPNLLFWFFGVATHAEVGSFLSMLQQNLAMAKRPKIILATILKGIFPSLNIINVEKILSEPISVPEFRNLLNNLLEE
jgi:hypothetical protein